MDASAPHAEREEYVSITLRVKTIALFTLSTNSITGQATSFADQTQAFLENHCLLCHSNSNHEDAKDDTWLTALRSVALGYHVLIGSHFSDAPLFRELPDY